MIISNLDDEVWTGPIALHGWGGGIAGRGAGSRLFSKHLEYLEKG